MAPFWSKSSVSDEIDPLDFSRPPLAFGKFLPNKSGASRFIHDETAMDPLDMSQPPASMGKFLGPMSRGNNLNANGIPKSITMLEMNEIHDMHQFGEAMDALSSPGGEQSKNQIVGQEGEGEDEDDIGGFFIDSSERDDDALDAAGSAGGKFLGLSTSPDSIIDTPQSLPPTQLKGGTGSGGGGMRRVMSQMSLTSAQRQHLMFDPEIHTISEEPDDHNQVADQSATKKKPQIEDEKKSYSRQPSLGESSHSDTTPLDNNSSHSLGRRRSSTRARSSGMPPRSSLKNSSNNLRSSLKSTDSFQSNGSSNNKLDSAMKRNVSFSSLEIRSYNVTLGDAPTPNGPAVSLAWEYDPQATTEYDLDAYENYRTDEAPRRNRSQMLMPASHRQYLLMREAGFTRGELILAMEEAKRVAKGRAKTAKRINVKLHQPVEEVLEKTRRKFSKLKTVGESGGSGRKL